MNSLNDPSRCVLNTFLAAVLLFAGIAPGAAQAETKQAGDAPVITSSAPASEHLLQRVVLIGASVTAGFNLEEPFGGLKTSQFRLRHFIEPAILAPHEPVVVRANAFFFTNPVETLRTQLKGAQEARPTAVVALDSLFWFCYGDLPSEQARLERFEEGLRMLAQVTVPIVIGDIPDASNAVGRILDKKQMPELGTIAQCNERLRAWAAERVNVRLFPLARLMAAASANESLQLTTHSWSRGETRALLQRDGLHPSTAGLAALAIESMITVAAAAQPSLPEDYLNRNLAAVLESAGARAAEEMQRKAEEQRQAEAKARAAAGQ